jgi:hypothetical protein
MKTAVKTATQKNKTPQTINQHPGLCFGANTFSIEGSRHQ